jgi:hypothetical protein
MLRFGWFRAVRPCSHLRLAPVRRLAGRYTGPFVLAALLGLSGSAGAQQVGPCATDGCIIDMAPPIYVANNQWGNNGYGWGSITVTSPTSWSTSWDFASPFDWTVMSYPSAILGWQGGYRFPNTGLPVSLASSTPINATVAFNVVPDPSCAPGGVGGGGTGSRLCRQDISYDLWLHDTNNPGTTNPVYEVMIWLAYSRELFSGTPAQAYATLGGHQWKVIQTQGGSTPVATFLLAEPADLTAATLNITDFTDWLVANQWVPATWWLDSVQFGTEIFDGKGTLNMTYYTVSVGTQPPLPPPPPPPPPPAPAWIPLGLSVNQATFVSGQQADIQIVPPNPAPATAVDVYFGAVLPAAAGPGLGCPGRDAVAFLVAGFTAVRMSCLSASPATFAALAQNVPTTAVPAGYTFIWQPGLPAGPYRFFVALTRPGALAASVIDPGDLLGLATAGAVFRP